MSTWSQRATWLVPVLVVLLGGGGLLIAVLGLPGGDDDPRPDTGSQERFSSGIQVARGEVRGTVLADGEPVAGVRVGLYAGEVATHPEVSAVSDRTGRFRLVGAQPGRAYVLETSGAAAGGGRQGIEWAPVEPVPLTLTPERGLGGVELVVSRTNEITGRLLLKGGEPLEGVDVIAYRRSSEARLAAGAPRREEWARAATDAKGRFTLPRVPDGEWIVRANETFGDGSATVGTQAAQTQARLGQAALDTFQRVRVRGDEPVKVSGGSRVDAGDLVTGRGRVLSGVVTDQNGVPVAGATVELKVEVPELVPVRTVTTDEAGRYRFIRLKARTVWIAATDASGRTGQHRAAEERRGGADAKAERGTPIVIAEDRYRTRADVTLAPLD